MHDTHDTCQPARIHRRATPHWPCEPCKYRRDGFRIGRPSAAVQPASQGGGPEIAPGCFVKISGLGVRRGLGCPEAEWRSWIPGVSGMAGTLFRLSPCLSRHRQEEGEREGNQETSSYPSRPSEDSIRTSLAVHAGPAIAGARATPSQGQKQRKSISPSSPSIFPHQSLFIHFGFSKRRGNISSVCPLQLYLAFTCIMRAGEPWLCSVLASRSGLPKMPCLVTAMTHHRRG